MHTITTVAPKSGCRLVRKATNAITSAIGAKPLVKECMYSWRRTVNQAAPKSAASFTTSVT